MTVTFHLSQRIMPNLLQRFHPIMISLSPNTSSRDIRLAWKLLLSPSRWLRGNSLSELEGAFRSDYQAAEAVCFDSGRSALLALLKSFGVGAGDEVLLQAYTCVVVPNAIRYAGATPVYVDIQANTFNMDVAGLEAKITPRTKVILVQHTFGLPADMPAIMLIAQRHHLIVIEDSAHALGATIATERGQQKVGTFGDGAVFSFGRDKVISSVFGGMAVMRDPKVGERLRKFQQGLPLPTKRWVVQQLLHPILFSLIIPLYFWQIGKVLLVLFQKPGLLSSAVYACEISGECHSSMPKQLPNAQATLALDQYRRLDTFNARRRDIAARYDAEITDSVGTKPAQPAGYGHCFLRYTVQTAERERLIQAAKKNAIQLGAWYDQAIVPGRADYAALGYTRGSCPVAERVAALSLNLPTYPRMREEEVTRVIECLNSNVQ